MRRRLRYADWRDDPNPRSRLDLQHGNPERRVDDLGRKVFERAVTIAATEAAQTVAQVHRRRLVVQSTVVTFVLCMGIALVLAFVFRSEAEDQARANSLANCQLVRALAGPLAEFVSSNVTLHAKQTDNQKGHIASVFSHLLGAKAYAMALASSNAASATAANTWKNHVVPELRAVAGVNCQVRAK